MSKQFSRGLGRGCSWTARVLSLAIACFIVCSPPASGAGPLAWTAQLTRHIQALQDQIYTDPNVYPSRQAAVAAMLALDPNDSNFVGQEQALKATLVPAGIAAETAGSVVYQ